MIGSLATIFILAVVAGYLFAEVKKARAETSRLQAEIEIERAYGRRVLDQAAEDRAAAAVERKELYQRIQAPEIAVHDAQLEKRRERPYVRRQPIGADDDAAFAARDKKGKEGTE